MTELSDYQRIVEKPNNQAIEDRYNALLAETDRLESLLKDATLMVDSIYPESAKRFTKALSDYRQWRNR